MAIASESKKKGTLTVVGVGIKLVAQTSLEAQGHIAAADKVLYLTTDPVTPQWIRSMNANIESLHPFYKRHEERLSAYLEMVDYVLEHVRNGYRTCFALYGHPGVAAYPSRRAIQRARNEGYAATMLAGISAEDCLFADLGVDPVECGCQSYEATDLLVFRRQFDPFSALVIWQIGVLGEIGHTYDPSAAKIEVLVERLLEHYPANHMVALYEAARYPICDPSIDWVPLDRLSGQESITPITTLFVPPVGRRPPDESMLERLGISTQYVRRREQMTAAEREALGL